MVLINMLYLVRVKKKVFNLSLYIVYILRLKKLFILFILFYNIIF